MEKGKKGETGGEGEDAAPSEKEEIDVSGESREARGEGGHRTINPRSRGPMEQG